MAELLDDPQQSAPGAPASDKPTEEKVDVAELQRQLNTEKALREAERQERERWQAAATARQAEKQPEKKEEAPEVDDLSEVDLVNIVSGNDVAGLTKVVQAAAKKMLKEMGITSKKDVEELVASRLSERESVSQGMNDLVNQHPDLVDSNSDLYKEAARQLEAIGKDPDYKGMSDFAKVKLATNLAASKLGSGKQTDSDRARVARIAAQQVTTGGRSSRTQESDELTEDEKAACTLYGVSEADFKKNKAEIRPRR